MKKQITRSLLYFSLIVIVVLSSSYVSAQAPQSLNYQAIARDANGAILVDRATGLRITVLNGPEGEILYQETHHSTTNQFGLLLLWVT